MKLEHRTCSKQQNTRRCSACGSALVYPLERSRAGDDGWRLLMRCPDCLAWHEASVERFEMLAIYQRQRDGVAALARQLDELERQHMVEECEKFISALNCGNIVPEDF